MVVVVKLVIIAICVAIVALVVVVAIVISISTVSIIAAMIVGLRWFRARCTFFVNNMEPLRVIWYGSPSKENN